MNKLKWNPYTIYDFRFDDQGWFSSCLIPKSVKVCPVCEGRLEIDATGWIEKTTNGKTVVMPDEWQLTCENENTEKCPFEAIENQMPYVYWLPVETTCTNWIQKMLKIYHGIKPIPKTWLERNGQLKLPFLAENTAKNA